MDGFVSGSITESAAPNELAAAILSEDTVMGLSALGFQTGLAGSEIGANTARYFASQDMGLGAGRF